MSSIKALYNDALFPTDIAFQHHLDDIVPFASFLQVNNIDLPGKLAVGSPNLSFINLNFGDNQWFGNLSYSGQSPLGGNESWHIITTFIPFPNLWQFSLNLVKDFNGNRVVTRLATYHPKSDVANSNDFFGFNFTLKANTLQLTPSTAQLSVLSDNNKFFGTKDFLFNIGPQNRSQSSTQFAIDNTKPYNKVLGR